MNVCDDAFWKQGRCFEWIFPSSFLPSVASSLLDDSMCWLFPVLTHRLHFSYDEPSMLLLLSSYFRCCCVNWSGGRLNWFLNHTFYGNSECEFTSRSRSHFLALPSHSITSRALRFHSIFPSLGSLASRAIWNNKKKSFTMELNTYDSFFRLLDEFWTLFFLHFDSLLFLSELEIEFSAVATRWTLEVMKNVHKRNYGFINIQSCRSCSSESEQKTIVNILFINRCDSKPMMTNLTCKFHSFASTSTSASVIRK